MTELRGQVGTPRTFSFSGGDVKETTNASKQVSKPAWEPEFDAVSNEQEQLAIKFCEEIAGKKGDKPSLPDPVRLLEMAQALYLAERKDSLAT